MILHDDDDDANNNHQTQCDDTWFILVLSFFLSFLYPGLLSSTLSSSCSIVKVFALGRLYRSFVRSVPPPQWWLVVSVFGLHFFLNELPQFFFWFHFQLNWAAAAAMNKLLIERWILFFSAIMTSSGSDGKLRTRARTHTLCIITKKPTQLCDCNSNK